MAIDGYAEEQYDELVRQVRSVPHLALGNKRTYDESSSEVPVIYSEDKRLLLKSIQ